MNHIFKEIFIGQLIQKRVQELEVSSDRLGSALQLSHDELEALYQKKTIDTALLLQCSKLLHYDFFRLYSQHLLFYAPKSATNKAKKMNVQSTLPQFKKSIYTVEMITFILELVEKGELTKTEIITKYNIPRTTLYKWIKKHQN